MDNPKPRRWPWLRFNLLELVLLATLIAALFALTLVLHRAMDPFARAPEISLGEAQQHIAAGRVERVRVRNVSGDLVEGLGELSSTGSTEATSGSRFRFGMPASDDSLSDLMKDLEEQKVDIEFEMRTNLGWFWIFPVAGSVLLVLLALAFLRLTRST